MKRKMGERRKEEAKKSKSEWPLIKPKANLSINRIKEDDLFTVRDYLTSIESKAFVKAAESMGFVHQGSLGPTFGEAFRDNDRISVSDPLLADKIWEAGLNKLLSDFKIRGKVAVGLNPNIRFYRYKVGQRFGRHIDESVDLEGGKRTHYTLLIYLSGGSKPKTKNDQSTPQDSSEALVGGETVFYGSRNSLVAEVLSLSDYVSCEAQNLMTVTGVCLTELQGKTIVPQIVPRVAPIEGMALLHIHGAKCMLHEARNVTKGVKYILRSDVVFA